MIDLVYGCVICLIEIDGFLIYLLYVKPIVYSSFS